MAPNNFVAAGDTWKLTMKYETIDQIIEMNARLGEKLEAFVQDLAPESLSRKPEDGSWSAAQVLEHLALVEDGMARICAKLLRKAEADGAASCGIGVSENFMNGGAKLADIKVKAPEMVEPSGAMPIEDALLKMRNAHETFVGLKSKFEEFNASSHTFPHPYLGELTAVEWLVLAGEHKRRHTRQIKNILSAI